MLVAIFSAFFLEPNPNRSSCTFMTVNTKNTIVRALNEWPIQSLATPMATVTVQYLRALTVVHGATYIFLEKSMKCIYRTRQQISLWLCIVTWFLPVLYRTVCAVAQPQPGTCCKKLKIQYAGCYNHIQYYSVNLLYNVQYVYTVYCTYRVINSYLIEKSTHSFFI